MSEETRKAESEIKPKAPRSAGVAFNDGFGVTVEIYPDSPMPEFDSGPVKAYLARDPGRSSTTYFALVCEKHLNPRISAVTHYKNVMSANLISLVSHGVVYWPPARQERYVFLYTNPNASRIQKPGMSAAMGWRQDTVMDSFIKPMATVLREFREANLVHNAIRPSNMYVQGSAGKSQTIILGDCLSLPASYLQPVLYEPIERAMAQPIGRGEGMHTDDMYAFGVSLAVLLRTQDTMQDVADDEIIRDKMENGSYVALTGKDRFKGSVLELLRGLLHDNPRERWTIEEVMTWIDGRRLSPKQTFKIKKAARPLTYANKKYSFTPQLAMDIDLNLQETARIVETGELDQWLKRSLDDEEITERVSNAIIVAREKGTGPGYEERLASNLSAALDPMSPIRYKNLRLMGDGIGDAFAEAIIMKYDISRFVDLFSHNIAFNWLTGSQNVSIDAGALIARFDQCRNFIRHGKVGYGFERCIYTLSPDCPCLSEKLRDYFIRTPEEMIKAFEDICQKGNVPALFLDRHSMAFLSAKDPKIIDSYLFDLGSPDEYRRVLGNLRCLGAIQKRSNLPAFPALAKAFVESLPAVYARYHDREIREKLESSIKKMAAEGDLGKMASLLSNVETMKKDYNGFRFAMVEYAQLAREHDILEMRLKDKSVFGKTTGKEFAAITSCILSVILILMSAAMFFSKSGTF